MQKDSSNYYENLNIVNIIVDEDSSHKNLLYQAVQGLVDIGWDSRKEIMEEWKMLLTIELDRIK